MRGSAKLRKGPRREDLFLRALPFVLICLTVCPLAFFALNAQMGVSNANLTDDESRFIQKAAMAGLTEVELGSLAAEKGSTEEVRMLGQRLRIDREALHSEYQKLARKKGVDLPANLDDRHLERVNAAAALNGGEFDRFFLDCVTHMHERELAELDKVRSSTDDDELKLVLNRATLVVKICLATLQELQSAPPETSVVGFRSVKRKREWPESDKAPTAALLRTSGFPHPR